MDITLRAIDIEWDSGVVSYSTCATARAEIPGFLKAKTNCSFNRVGLGNHFSELCPLGVVSVLRYADSGKDANNRNDHHQFD